jgi:hypothetical protein
MGFVFKKHHFRQNEVISVDKIKDNFKTFIHQMNGNLDRENLPENAINNRQQFELGCFTQVESKSFPSNNLSLEGEPVHFVNIVSDEFTVPVDSVIIANCGFTYQWQKTTFSEQISGAAITSTSTIALFAHNETLYDNIGEFFVDFVLKINGETVCEAPKNTFLRLENSLQLSGVLPVSAGKCVVKLQARQYRLVGASGSLKKDFRVSKEFFVKFSKFRKGQLLCEVKRR